MRTRAIDPFRRPVDSFMVMDTRSSLLGGLLGGGLLGGGSIGGGLLGGGLLGGGLLGGGLLGGGLLGGGLLGGGLLGGGLLGGGSIGGGGGALMVTVVVLTVAAFCPSIARTSTSVCPGVS